MNNGRPKALLVRIYDYRALLNTLALLLSLCSFSMAQQVNAGYYQCQTDCYDLIIYDNFEKTQRESSERVLSFEGVNNGINSSLYFKRFNGQWYLVKYEEFDT